jgi:tetratricopeptide (TPR) repeat protein
MSEMMDNGSWLFGAIAVLFVSMAFFATVNLKLEAAYRIPAFNEFYSRITTRLRKTPNKQNTMPPVSSYNKAMNARQTIPIVGDRFFSFFSFEASRFYQPVLSLSIFYVPAVILLMCLFGGVGSFGLVLRRDYGTLAVCTLNAWAAAHLPFAVAGIALSALAVDPRFYLAFWAAGGLLFGILMIFALRTVFGANYGTAILVVSVAWLSLSLGMYVSRNVSPWLFSPFLLFYALMYFGGSVGGEVRGFGNAFRQRQNFKRFLHNATVNPRDADAHVQLGIIYLQRRQESKALEHLNKAFEIDNSEIDANYELGKIARQKGELQKALDHFAVVVEQNDKHSLSEIWREIGVTYLAAGMHAEARDALEKYVDRRSGDVEGLYYLGKVLKAQGEMEKAREMFDQAVLSANASPDFRRRNTRQWSKLAEKELRA